MMTNIISILQSDDYFGGGEFIEIAKGRNEYASNFKVGKRKIKRAWRSKRK